MSKIDCSFWSEGENSSYGICSKKLYGGSPSFGVCLYACEQYDGPERTLELIQLTLSQRSIKQSKGLGDSIEKVTKAILKLAPAKNGWGLSLSTKKNGLHFQGYHNVSLNEAAYLVVILENIMWELYKATGYKKESG